MVDERDNPATVSGDYAAMKSKWQKIRTVLAGTEALRKAGREYLPQFPKELDTYYEHRLAGTTLLNMSKLTLNSWVGRPFSDPVQVSEDTPTQLEEIYADVDRRKTKLSVFLRDWFYEGLAMAHAHVLVNSPKVAKVDGKGKARTKADDAREGIRPFWSFLRPEAVLFMSSTHVGSQEVLTHVRILETEKVRDKFTEVIVNRIRVFDRVFGEGEDAGVFETVYKLAKTKKKRAEWTIDEKRTKLDIDEIPLVTFYSDREGIQKGEPPLEGLVDLNLAHWRSSSDNNNILTVTRFPIIGASGVTQDEANNVVLAPRKILATRNEKGKFYYLEHSGNAMKVGADDLARLEEQMAHYGADFLRKQPGGVTATAKALDSAEATSPLQDAVNRFNEAVEEAVRLTALWLRLEQEPGTVEVTSDFGPEEIVGDDLMILREARKMRDLSRAKFLDELVRRGVLSDEFNSKENDTEIENEAAVFGGATLGDFGDDEGGKENEGNEGDEA